MPKPDDTNIWKTAGIIAVMLTIIGFIITLGYTDVRSDVQAVKKDMSCVKDDIKVIPEKYVMKGDYKDDIERIEKKIDDNSKETKEGFRDINSKLDRLIRGK